MKKTLIALSMTFAFTSMSALADTWSFDDNNIALLESNCQCTWSFDQ
ncbi:MAG: hypothetical protein U9R28_03805 [Pseudomonadota bacterium]|nr:hypothetical protein [Pseudomonadota bacterium]